MAPPDVEPLQPIGHARLAEAERTCARLNPYRIWAEDVSPHNGAKRYACMSVEGMAAELASAGERTQRGWRICMARRHALAGESGFSGPI
jgi:hypothetical protein